MSDLEQLKREQERTNWWLAFIAGSMVSLPAWLTGAIHIALIVFVVVAVLFMAGAYIWFELLDRSFGLLMMWIGIIGLALCWAFNAQAQGAMFWDSNGNYIGQALPAGPNAVQVWNGRGEYVGQALKSGPNAVQFYGGDGSYQGQAIGTGPKVNAMEALSGVNPHQSLSELSGIDIK